MVMFAKRLNCIREGPLVGPIYPDRRVVCSAMMALNAVSVTPPPIAGCLVTRIQQILRQHIHLYATNI